MEMSDDSILREKAREVAGNLPNRRPYRMWGGSGDGAQCTVCGAPVKHDEVQLELEFTGDDGAGASNYHCHIRCFSALELELRNLELAERTISARDQTQSATATTAMAAGRQNGT
jgi:hypothetical protein